MVETENRRKLKIGDLILVVKNLIWWSFREGLYGKMEGRELLKE